MSHLSFSILNETFSVICKHCSMLKQSFSESVRKDDAICASTWNIWKDHRIDSLNRIRKPEIYIFTKLLSRFLLLFFDLTYNVVMLPETFITKKATESFLFWLLSKNEPHGKMSSAFTWMKANLLYFWLWLNRTSCWKPCLLPVGNNGNLRTIGYLITIEGKNQ